VTNLVAAWLDGTYDNDGIVLLGSADVNHADFTTSDDSDPSARPQLTIDYTCPCAGCSDPPTPPQVVLLVVPDAAILSAQDTVKKTLIESWNFAVTLISATATQDDFVRRGVRVGGDYVERSRHQAAQRGDRRRHRGAGDHR
jgi:hypothetical protein